MPDTSLNLEKSLADMLEARMPTGPDAYVSTIKVPLTAEGGILSMRAFDALGGLQNALIAALNTELPSDIEAVIATVTQRFLKSKSHPPRSPGDIVWLSGGQGFGASPGRWRIAAREDDFVCSCPLCGRFSCQEWPTLVKLDENNSPLSEFAYHVSECEMDSAPPQLTADEPGT